MGVNILPFTWHRNDDVWAKHWVVPASHLILSLTEDSFDSTSQPASPCLKIQFIFHNSIWPTLACKEKADSELVNKFWAARPDLPSISVDLSLIQLPPLLCSLIWSLVFSLLSGAKSPLSPVLPLAKTLFAEMTRSKQGTGAFLEISFPFSYTDVSKSCPQSL